jgi:tetratricopeptide (TPR) repeat protein
VARRFPADDDAAVLHADARMNLSPWSYWTADRGPRPDARAAIAELERVLARNPRHAGACHYYIHAVEAAHPEKAVPCADRLASLMPGVGHIVHMPAHVYVRVGRYADAIEQNVHAVHADEKHLDDESPDGTYRLAYHPHNWHFLWFAATMAGRSETALEAARTLSEKVNRKAMRTTGLGALQHYLVTPLFAMVRFGRWDRILAEPAPPADLPYATGVWHYARAVALAANGRYPQAEAEIGKLRAARRHPALETMTIRKLNPASAVLDLAIASARAELALGRGRIDEAIGILTAAVKIEDGLGYDAPPTWHLPIRHLLGDALLRAGRAAEAERVYRQDLVRHPENGWALQGLERSLLAQKKAAEATTVRRRVERAWRLADVRPGGSRL